MSGPATGWWRRDHGVRLRWLRWDASAPRGGVLLLHGFGDHVERYEDAVRVLRGRGWSVLGYDHRGHGGSEGRRGDAPSFETFLEDLDAAWAEAVATLPEPVVLYAHSFGALVAIRWIQTRADRPAAVVLSAPWLATAMPVPGWKRAAERVFLRIAPGLAIPSGSGRPHYLTRDPDRAAAYRADRRVHHRITARFHRGVVDAQSAAAGDGWPAELPTLVVAPGDDPLVDAGVTLRWARSRPGLEVRERPGGRHELHNDLDREPALAGIADWLDRAAPAEPEGSARVLAPEHDTEAEATATEGR